MEHPPSVIRFHRGTMTSSIYFGCLLEGAFPHVSWFRRSNFPRFPIIFSRMFIAVPPFSIICSTMFSPFYPFFSPFHPPVSNIFQHFPSIFPEFCMAQRWVSPRWKRSLWRCGHRCRSWRPMTPWRNCRSRAISNRGGKWGWANYRQFGINDGDICSDIYPKF